MWSTPSSIARRRTARAPSGSRGGPNTPGPASCIAPKPMRLTGLLPIKDVLFIPIACASGRRWTRGLKILGAGPPAWLGGHVAAARPPGRVCCRGRMGITSSMPESRRVPFSAVEPALEAPGIASRALDVNGVRWAIVEYEPGVLREEWCTEGHSGYLLAGEIEYEFQE